MSLKNREGCNVRKCAVVTGAAGGIGKAIAEALAGQDHDVVVVDINANGQEVADAISGHFVSADLTSREACQDIIDDAVRTYGRIDILVNNAGFQQVAPIEDFPEDTWDQMLGVMLRAPFLLTKYAWPHMKKNGWGRVVNISSILGLVGTPNKAAYVSAKHGVIGLTKTAAHEGGAHGITVNALCPSYVRTPLVENQVADQARVNDIPEDEVIEKIMLAPTSIKRLVEPEEIGKLVVYLCSDDAASVTGACWTIDCGWTAQ
jgi:3-hydroxybutyrate dehydrogenase